MNLLHEWPLVLFTLTVQAAVGLHVALLATGALPREGDASEHSLPWDRGSSILAGVLMALALLTSFLHLGAPVNALHTLANLDQSWLSREILAALLFLGLWGVGYRLGKRSGLTPWVGRTLAWATGLAGVVLIWVMARIYMVPARPLWDHWLTPAGFFLTALLLGTAILAAQEEGPLMAPGNSDSRFSVRMVLPTAGIAVAVAQLVMTLAHPLTREAMGFPHGTQLVALRLLLLLSGGVLLAVPLLRSPDRDATSPTTRNAGLWPALALLLLGASEILGRVLFYAVGTVNPF